MNSFIFDQRLGISIPNLHVEWESLSINEQETIIQKWDVIRESIPDRIIELESKIRERQYQLDIEDDFIKSCNLNSEISELASIINDLNLWYRVDQDVSDDKPHS